MYLSPLRTFVSFLLICIAVNAACAAKIDLKDPLRLSDGQAVKAIYYFPHWWDPWKSDDSVISADLTKMKSLGLNTVCLDHEVSQAIDRDWYWLDREYQLVGKEKMQILPWLQLQSVDRISLMKFSHRQLRQAVNQDGQPEEDCADYRDPEFRTALAHYITVYLDRYINDPSLLKVKDKGKDRPVVGLMLETGWRNPSGQPLSFDEDTNNFFRRWMKSTYFDLKQLNTRWGTNYKSFDEIDPCDKAIFNYAHEDKENMPLAVREHAAFRARVISDALQDVAKQVRKRHKDVLFVAEVAYPFSADHPDARAYRWNNANEYKAVEFADIIFIRNTGSTTSGPQAKEQDLMMLNGKRLIQAYRLYDGSTPSTATALALDCALTGNGFAYYNWNEMADDATAIYDKPERQNLVSVMTSVYDMLYDTNVRHDLAVPAPLPVPAPAPVPVVETPAPDAAPPTVVNEVETVEEVVVPDASEPVDGTPQPVDDVVEEDEAGEAGTGELAPAIPVPESITP